MNPVEQHISKQPEPYQSIMLYIRSVIKKTLPDVKEKYSYKIPFYNCYNKPMLYMGVLKGTNYVDVAFVQGIILEQDFLELKDYKNRKQVRSLQVSSIEDFDELMFVGLLKKASELLKNTKKAWYL